MFDFTIEVPEVVDGIRLSRRDNQLKAINCFLNTPNATELKLRLYGREILALERIFPDVAITKCGIYDPTIKLFDCVVKKRNK